MNPPVHATAAARSALLTASLLALLLTPTVGAATLSVGPGKRFARPSEAVAAARPGDVVEIDSTGRYDGDVAVISTRDLTIRGIGKGRAVLDCKGKSAARKGIFVQAADNLTVENIEFVGARAPDENGAGIRAQGRGLVVRRCRFYDCENGILGGAGEVLVEHSEFDHCGHSTSPSSPTHSAYFGHEITKLTFQFNYSTHTLEGHLLKSRARESYVLYNRLTDEHGLGSAVADFPNGGFVVVLGNVMHKGPKAHNSQVIMWGTEGLRHERNGLYVVHNTLLYEQRRPGRLAHVTNAPDKFRPVLRNNVCAAANLTLTNIDGADAGGNLLCKTLDEPGFTDVAKWDLRPRPDSPCVDKGVDLGNAGDFPLAPRFHYSHPVGRADRPRDRRPDVGAFEAGSSR